MERILPTNEFVSFAHIPEEFLDITFYERYYMSQNREIINKGVVVGKMACKDGSLIDLYEIKRLSDTNKLRILYKSKYGDPIVEIVFENEVRIVPLNTIDK